MPASPVPVPILGTELLSVHSQRTGGDYGISVGVPSDHADSGDRLPVVYVLDGQWDFKLLMSIFGALRFDRWIPDVVVVGVGHPAGAPDIEALRTRDYTPTVVSSHTGSGHAARFLEFLMQELIPLVERRYPVDLADRTLVGSSLGGLFGLYAVLEQPDLFRRGVFVSPAISWDDEVIFRSEETFASERRELAVRLFLAAGELESPRMMREPVRRMVERLRRRGYEGLELTDMTIPGERHAGVKAEAFTRGLRSVFAEPILELSAAELDRYAGSYRRGDGQSLAPLDFERDEDRLVLRGIPGGIPGAHEADELLPIASDRFRFAAAPAEITFHRTPAGEVLGATVHLAHGDEQLTRES